MPYPARLTMALAAAAPLIQAAILFATDPWRALAAGGIALWDVLPRRYRLTGRSI